METNIAAAESLFLTAHDHQQLCFHMFETDICIITKDFLYVILSI